MGTPDCRNFRTYHSFMKPLLLLDRDGVLNEPPTPPHRYILSIDQLRLRESVIREIKRIQEFAFVAVVSNQQSIGKGMVTVEQVEEMNEHINEILAKQGGSAMKFFICPHLEEAKCLCRKPNPGLLYQAINLHRRGNREKCLFIGDQATDHKAALNAGVKFRLVHDEKSTIKVLKNLTLSSFI